MTDTCAFPGCTTPLRDQNVIGVCRTHIHSKQCKCKSCLGMGRDTLRVRSRAELVAMGLLPKERIFT